MKKIIVTILLPLAVLMGAVPAVSQSLTVKMFNGTEHSKPLNTIQSMTFPAGQLFIKYTNAGTESFTLSEVRSVLFFGTPMLISEMPSVTDYNYSVYPNPAGTTVSVSGLDAGTQRLRVYNLYGALLIDAEVNAAACTLDISSLESGLYFIELNHHVIKMSKI